MMTGTGEATIFSMMSRVESTRPPGVLISIRTAWSWFAAATASARPIYSAVTGWMASFTAMRKTSAEQDAARTAEARRANQKPDVGLRLRTENRELRTGLEGFMAVAAAALSPRAWLPGCASFLGRRNCRAPVAGRD